MFIHTKPTMQRAFTKSIISVWTIIALLVAFWWIAFSLAVKFID